MADYQSHYSEFEKNDISIYALSTDSADNSKATVAKHGLAFPVLYGVDAASVAQAWGSYHDAGRNILHATGFILKPDGTILSATYSTGAFGRLVAREALAFIKYIKSQG